MLNEVKIFMSEDGIISLETTHIPGISETTWHGDKDDSADLSKVKSWDLSHNNLPDAGLQYLADKTGDGPWDAMESINLSYNRLSVHCFPVLTRWARTFPIAVFELSYNSMKRADIERLPNDIRDRVEFKCDYDEEIVAMRGDLRGAQDKWNQIHNWQRIEDDVLEEELTRYVEQYYKDSGYSTGTLSTTKVYDKDGQVILELDGLIVAESTEECPLLITIEAKHSLKEMHINARQEKLSKFVRFLSSIPENDDKSARPKYRSCCGNLRPYMNYECRHYIGGVNVPVSVKAYAQRKGFYVLQYRGDRYDKADPTSAFVLV